MIYAMNQTFYKELRKVCITDKNIISYINETFGLKREITEVRVIG